MNNNKYANLADEKTIETTKQALEKNGFSVIVAENSGEAKEKALSLIPEGAEVMTASSQTLEMIGINQEINESGKFDSVRARLMKMDRNSESLQMQKIGAAPEYVIGSVHAVTEDGKVLIASMSGSQLPSYVYGASHVVWVVSTKKITKDLDDGIKRIYEHVLPLESERVKKAYGIPASDVKKLLIFNSEQPGRITIILVKKDLGF